MTNTLLKAARNLIVVPDPVAPPPPPTYRLIRRTGQRPKYEYTAYIAIDFINIELGRMRPFQLIGVESSKVRAGIETYEYYEWVENATYVPPVQTPVVTPIPDAWDATARSGMVATDPMAVEWTVNQGNVDMIVGMCTSLEEVRTAASTPLSDQNARAAALRDMVIHGFRIIGGAAHVHAAPPPGFGAVRLDIRRPTWGLTNDSVCRLEITRGIVTYLIDGEIIATGPAFVHPGQAIYLRGLLFGKRDSIDNPLLEALDNNGEGSVTIGPLTAKGGGFAEGRAMLGPLTVQSDRFNRRVILGPLWARGSSAEEGGRANIELAPLAAGGWGLQLAAGNASFTLAPLTAKGATTRYGDATAMLGWLWVAARGKDTPPGNNAIIGLAGRWDAQRAPGNFAGAYAVAGVGVTFAAQLHSPRTLRARIGLRGRMKMSRVWAAALRAAVGLRTKQQAQRVFDVVLLTDAGISAAPLGLLIITAEFDTSLGLDALYGATRLADARIRSQLGARIGTDSLGLYSAAIRALLSVGVTGVRDPSDYLVWSVERAGASSAYSNFAFNSFARVGGRIFAAGDTGLYELAGDNDAGVPIDAWADLGKRSFGSSLEKGIANAYLTVSSEAKMVVRVTTNDKNTYRYEARSWDTDMRAQRVDFGRGLRATYLNLEVMNLDGAAFDLEQLEFVVTESKRRI